MRSTLVTLFVLSCGAPAQPPTSEHRVGAAASPSAPTCGQGLRGTVTVATEQQAAVGATVVASRAHDFKTDPPVVITDERGQFSFADVNGLDTLTIYYADTAFEGPLPRGCKPLTIEIDATNPTPGQVRRWIAVDR